VNQTSKFYLDTMSLDMVYVSRALNRVRKDQDREERSHLSFKDRLRDIWQKLASRFPFLRSFNFILIHYIYLITMALLGSVILYPGGTMSYTDSLFHSAGASTQSGLNSININEMRLYQQVSYQTINVVIQTKD